MKIENTYISDLIILEPSCFQDERGFFFEGYNSDTFKTIFNKKMDFVQDNQSKSFKGVLRGLHYQIDPMAQGKLVRVLNGKIFDVAVDLRKNSDTFSKWFGIELSADNKKQLWIPRGFAHGFLSLDENTEVLYKTTNFYSPDHERTIIWNDKSLAINWPFSNKIIISAKDENGVNLDQAELFE